MVDVATVKAELATMKADVEVVVVKGVGGGGDSKWGGGDLKTYGRGGNRKGGIGNSERICGGGGGDL
ncbi:hypothetical protein RJ640_022391 [Escallonia rubra]|uniref:Uncharacterized protein n=1 Tax=Escallonia rubra TaxID=112253 RepID=A0AA88RX44_9ASTE|nr:hypothetical protein RJ640_022391 [Escallonia rubra]